MFWDSNDQGDHPFEFEPLADQRLPLVCFAGLKESVIVAQDSGPVEGIVQRTARVFGGFVNELIRPIGPEKLRKLAPQVMVTVALKDFLAAHPHPPQIKSEHCVSLPTRSADWYSGARFCNACRDRLALVVALEHHAAVRVIPTNSL